MHLKVARGIGRGPASGECTCCRRTSPGLRFEWRRQLSDGDRLRERLPLCVLLSPLTCPGWSTYSALPCSPENTSWQNKRAVWDLSVSVFFLGGGMISGIPLRFRSRGIISKQRNASLRRNPFKECVCIKN